MAANRRIMEAKRLMLETFGYNGFRAGQEEIITSVLDGRDVLGVLPTGGGKSICYQIPAMVFPACTLVVSPLVALMTDQVNKLTSLGIPAACIHSGIPLADVNQIVYAAHQGKLKLLYVAPERLESESFRSTLASISLSLLAIDEAHCISEWGHDFRPAYRSIIELFDNRMRVPIVAVTATATPDVRDDIVTALRLQKPTVIVRGFDRPNLAFEVVGTQAKVEYLTQLIKRSQGQPILVYAGSRRRVDTTVEELRKRKLNALGYHAGKQTSERSAVQQAFVSGQADVLVATNAFGMGIDKPNIRHVVHTDLTLTVEAYYQEAGRAGRDGLPSTCTLLYTPEDKRLMDFFIECTFPEEKQIRAVLDYILYRSGGTISHQPLLIDEAAIAVELHEPIARVKGVLGVLQRNGAMLRTSPVGTTVILSRTTPDRLLEYAQNQVPERKASAEAIWRLLQGSSYEMGATINAQSFVRKHGLTMYEFHQTLQAMLLQGLIQFREPELGGAIVMVADYQNHGVLPVNVDQLHSRRNHAQHKLASMIEFATTANCKRNYVLEYFGDSEQLGNCKRCSSCKSASRPVKVQEEVPGHSISVIRAIYELNGRFGKHVVADVLSGTVSERVVMYRLDRAVTWGGLRSLSREHIMHLIDGAITRQFVTRSSGTFPTLAVTKQGMNTAESLPRRLDLSLTTIRKVDAGVYGAIVMLRDQIAEREQVTPISVLPLSAIERIATDRPARLSELKPGEHGSGLFLARYGDEVVEAVTRAIQKSALAIPKVRADADIERIASLVEQHTSLEGVARAMRVTTANAAQLLQRAIEAGIPVNVHRIIPSEVIEAVANFMRDHRYAKLRHVREHVEATAELPELRVAMALARRELYGVPL